MGFSIGLWKPTRCLISERTLKVFSIRHHCPRFRSSAKRSPFPSPHAGSSEMDFDNYGTHVVGGLVKHFFECLPDPIIPKSLCSAFLACSGDSQLSSAFPRLL